MSQFIPSLQLACEGMRQMAIDSLLLICILYFANCAFNCWNMFILACPIYVDVSVLEILFMCSNCPSPYKFWTLKPHLWYICTTCLMVMETVAAFSFLISSAVQKCLACDVVMTNGNLFMYIMSASRVTVLCVFCYLCR